MALGAETAARPFPAGGEDGDSAAAVATVFVLGTDEDRRRPLVDPMIWGDERRMKRELMVWAKAVASMAAANAGSSPLTTPPMSPSMR
uniref:Uncharacterized protein n=1 Tax=Leersia perrieri TaxID=77586 RepID=A0A0D9WND9_9ORYZ